MTGGGLVNNGQNDERSDARDDARP